MFKKIIIYVILILGFSQSINAQNIGCYGTLNIKAEKYFQAALKKSKISRNEAEKLLVSAIKIDPKYTDAYFLLGTIYFEKAEKFEKKEHDIQEIQILYKNSRKAFKKVIKLCENYNDYDSYLFIAKTYLNQKQYIEARYYLSLYKNKTNNFLKIKETEILLDEVNKYIFLYDNPVKYSPVKLNYVSTALDEYLPVLSPDGEQLFFTRKENIQGEDDFHEIFMISKRIHSANSVQLIYSQGDTLPFPFNDGRNQGAATITMDNNTMYLTICGTEKGSYTSYKNCDIYETVKTAGKWSYLNLLDKNINGKSTFESQPSVTPDGNTLFFASAREGGFGGIDIYRSVKDENGNWSKAANLGAQINTEGDDKTPFIHSDGKTLYFSTDARPGIGGFDVYFSVYDSIRGWSEVKNLGYPINTVNDEVAFCVSVDGSKIFFSTNKISKEENWEIYTTEMPEFARPQKVLLVKGKVYGDDGDTITNTNVTLTSLKTLKETKGIVEENTGNYSVSVNVEKDEKFIIEAQKNGYFYSTEYIDPTENKYIPPTKLDMEVKKIQKHEKYILPTVYFDFNSSELSNISKLALKSLVKFLNANPKLKIQIMGHTDNIGSDEANLTLSMNRALSVKQFLTHSDIDENRLKIKAYGESKPDKDNETAQGRQKNRRVEIIFLYY